MIALSILGSATLLLSCSTSTESTDFDYETLLTESSENRTIIMMENGKRSYTFSSPLMEGYSLATNPYQEFRRGIKMITYTDTLSLVDATITANYAIYYERQKLWEAKGNVVIIKNNRKEGDTTVTGLTEIYTQQLFWNASTKKIYSNVDTKVLQPDGWHFGVGFDADEDLKNIHFRKYSSEMEFDSLQAEANNSKSEDAKDKEKREEKKGSATSDKSKAEKNGESKSNTSGYKKPGSSQNSNRAPGRSDRGNRGGGTFTPSSVNPLSSSVSPASAANNKFEPTPVNQSVVPSAGGRPSGSKRAELPNNQSLSFDTELKTEVKPKK